MAIHPRRIGLFLLAALGIFGYLLVNQMPVVLERYQRTAAAYPTLGYLYLGAVAVGALILVVLSCWIGLYLWRNTAHKRSARHGRTRNPSELSPASQSEQIEHNLDASRRYASAPQVSNRLRQEIDKELAQLESKRQKQRLEIVAFGTISSGKSTLLNALVGRELFASGAPGGTTTSRCQVPWPGKDEVVLVDTPGLAEVRGEGRAAEAAEAAKSADLVLLVVDGPLKDYEVDLAGLLSAMEKRIVVCLNKEDWYDPSDRRELVEQIAQQLPGISRQDIVPVQARSVSRRQMRLHADGTEQETFVEAPADTGLLAMRMMEIVERDGRDLLLANLLLQSRGLVDQAKERVRAALDERADEIIRQHMWAAGSIAGINPIPLLDLAGGGAVTVKMVLELARTYQQPLDTDTAIQLLEGLGKNLVATVGATVATPAVAAAIGTLLKTVPGIGTITGGLLQGATQALVTRWIGNTFVEYFHQEMKPPPGGLAELARQQWTELTTANAIRRLVRAGREQWNKDQVEPQ
jgi:uncharacterized protein